MANIFIVKASDVYATMLDWYQHHGLLTSFLDLGLKWTGLQYSFYNNWDMVTTGQILQVLCLPAKYCILVVGGGAPPLCAIYTACNTDFTSGLASNAILF